MNMNMNMYEYVVAALLHIDYDIMSLIHLCFMRLLCIYMLLPIAQ